MVVRPQLGVDDRRLGVRPHAQGAHDMAGALVVLAVLNRGSAHRLKDPPVHVTPLGHPLARIVVDPVGDARPRHAEAVGPVEVGDDAVLRIRQLLDQAGEAQLACDPVANGAVQLLTAHPLADQFAGQ